jgi:hypothetical protein
MCGVKSRVLFKQRGKREKKHPYGWDLRKAEPTGFV